MVKVLNRELLNRMVRGGSSSKSGSGSGSGGGGSAAYAAEAGHAQEADFAQQAGDAVYAGHADTATTATHATTADTATEAGHATTADSATEAGHATSAADLDQNSSVWSKVLRKDVADTAAEIITFAQGLVSTLVAKFKAGLKIGANDEYGIDSNGDATLRDVSGRNISASGTLGVTGNATVGGTLGVTGKLTGADADFEDVTAETLQVTKEAHFTKLVVDELLSNKGAIILSSANCVIEAVSEAQTYYEIYFASTDRDGNSVSNSWRTGDMALCLTFKAEGAGTFNDVKNRYYWRRVTVASDETMDGVTYHVIRLSKVSGEYDGSTVPEAGDNLVQLGYTGNDAAYRQSAVILSSYPTMDAGVTPPSLAFYKGINDFSLSTHRYTYVDGLNNEFMGNFKILVNGSYTNLTSVLATLEGLITTVKKTVRGKNILPLGGWTDGYGDLLGSENYEEARQMLTNAMGSSFEDVVYSPIFFLAAGTYTFSCYTTETALELWLYGDGNNKQTPFEFIDAIDTYTLSNVVSGDTYQSAQRRYVTFTLDSDNYVCLNMYENSLFTMYRPMLETGDSCSAWECGNQEFSSQVKQTAEGYNISIRDNLGLTGIDISNHTIELRADKVTFANSAGTVSGKVQIDATKGTLVTENAKLGGNLFLPYVRITSSNYQQYTTTLTIGTTTYLVLLMQATNNMQLEYSGLTDVRLPYIAAADAAEMMGCELNILNMTGRTLDMYGGYQDSSHVTRFLANWNGSAFVNNLSLGNGIEAKVKLTEYNGEVVWKLV